MGEFESISTAASMHARLKAKERNFKYFACFEADLCIFCKELSRVDLENIEQNKITKSSQMIFRVASSIKNNRVKQSAVASAQMNNSIIR